MLFAIGAASSAIDLLKSLTSSKTSATNSTAFSATTASSGVAAQAAVSGAPAPKGNVAPDTMSALLDAQGQSTAASSTTATKSQSKALKDLFNLIDGNGDGSVSLDEIGAALKGKGKKKPAEEKVEQTDPLLKALDEANKAQAASRSAASSYTMTDQAVQRMTQMKAAAKASTLSVSA